MGIEIEFISSEVLAEKNAEDKIDFILKKIKDNKILVLEDSLSPLDETSLIQQTMADINERFQGIEITTLKDRKDAGGIRDRLIKLLGGKTGGLTIVGPSKLIHKVKKEPQKILLFAGIENSKGKKKKKNAP